MESGKHIKTIRVFSLLILFYLVVVQLTANPSWVFHHLTTKDGLSNSSVSAILKDSYGFLWIGTEYGLNRFDGYEFKVYSAKPGVPNTMVANNVWGLQEDGLGNIWINSFSDMVYNLEKDNFITNVPVFLENLGISVDRNYKVYVDKKKDLWVLSGQKAFFYDTRKKNLKIFNIEIQLDDVVTAELSDDGESLYGILKPGILWRINKQTGIRNVTEMPVNINVNLYHRLYVDYRGGLWIWSSRSDVICYKKDQSAVWEQLQLTQADKVQFSRILSLQDDKNGHIWIGTDHNGLFIYDIAGREVTNLVEDQRTESSIASNNIRCLYLDDNGIIWMGHNKKGISYFHNSFQNIVNYEYPACRDVAVILEDHKGQIWLGTDGNGLFLLENKVNAEIRKLPVGDSPVVSLLEDRKGQVWIGTYSHGLYCYKNGRFVFFTKENSNLASNDIWSLKEDRYGNLWIGSLAGAIQCLRSGNENMNSLETVCEGMRYPLDMFYDNGDKLYIGTINGLYTVDITTGQCHSHTGNIAGTQGFNQNTITNVYKDNKEIIWLGHAEGLILWDLKKDTLYYINKENGLRDNVIRGIVEDNHQNLWVTTSNGLSVLSVEKESPGNLKVSCKNFSDKDGFSDNYFNNHAICKLRSGDILVGGTEGYSIINPNKMTEENQSPAKVVFTGLKIGNHQIYVDSVYRGKKLLERPMEQTHSLTFRHNDKLISIQFTSGDLLYSDKVKYAYKLDGFHEQWQVTPENRLVFSTLPPGDYKLNVKASNSDGIWSNQVSFLNISVKPPFYFSGWAIFIYAMSVISLFFYIVLRIQKRHKKKLETQKIQIEREQEANFYEMKLRFFTNISHDLRTPLTLILSPLQTLLNGSLEPALHKKLVTINKSAEQLLQLINTLLDFRKLDFGAEVLRLNAGDLSDFINELCVPFNAYAIERKISFTVVNETENLKTSFDSDKIRKILLNLLSNAFKYTPEEGNITVRIYRENESICVAVSDSGEGISDVDKPHVFERFYQGSRHKDKTGSGLGLHIVKEYVTMHGGVISVEDNKPQGSIFVFRLAVFNNEITEESAPNTTDNEELFEEEEENVLPANPVLLFVDDNKDFCEFMADSLSDEYTVLLAYNGQEALEQLQKNDVTIVVSDVMMPVMSGTELCEQIKTNIQWSHIPVILLTARTAEEYQLEGLKLGADDYLTKPFNFNLLKLRIRKFLEWTEKCHLSFSQKMDVSPSEITITSLDEQLIGKAIIAVEEHIEDPEFSVEDLGSVVGLSRSHLYKKLMSITGKGPAEFIRIIRLKRGRQLLEKSQLQIAEIAYAVGFNSPKRFSVNFKNEFGISPSDHLRRLNKTE